MVFTHTQKERKNRSVTKTSSRENNEKRNRQVISISSWLTLNSEAAL